MIRVLPRKNHGENGELRMVNCEFRTQNCADYVLSAAAKTGANFRKFRRLVFCPDKNSKLKTCLPRRRQAGSKLKTGSAATLPCTLHSCCYTVNTGKQKIAHMFTFGRGIAFETAPAVHQVGLYDV